MSATVQHLPVAAKAPHSRGTCRRQRATPPPCDAQSRLPRSSEGIPQHNDLVGRPEAQRAVHARVELEQVLLAAALHAPSESVSE